MWQVLRIFRQPKTGVKQAPGGGKDMGLPKPPPFPRGPIDNSSTLSGPGMILFYKTPLQSGEDPADRANRIEIRDVRCRGAMLGTDWMFGDEVLCFTIINSMDWHNPSSTLETTRQDVLITGVEVDGYKSPALGTFENSCACITVLGSLIATDNYNLEGITDGDAFGLSNGGLLAVVPAEGDVTISNSTFRNCRLGPGVVGYKDGNLLFENLTTDGCRGNCLQLFDNSNCRIVVRDCDLFCDSFILPPELAVGGAMDVPSSVGCVVAVQGAPATVGFSANIQWLTLAADGDAHDAHPEAGPIGTWRGQGPAFLPAPSTLNIVENSCRSSSTPNTYCIHVADLSNGVFGVPSIDPRIRYNECQESETCISLEHVVGGRVRNNDCSSKAFGVELYNSTTARVRNNNFNFPPEVAGCEIRILVPGDKIDLSRVVPGAGNCSTG
jgi:parallel beta-helix repeat protein